MLVTPTRKTHPPAGCPTWQMDSGGGQETGLAGALVVCPQGHHPGDALRRHYKQTGSGPQKGLKYFTIQQKFLEQSGSASVSSIWSYDQVSPICGHARMSHGQVKNQTSKIKDSEGRVRSAFGGGFRFRRTKERPQSSFAPAGLWDRIGYRYPPLKRWAIVDRPCGADGPTQEDWSAVHARRAIESSCNTCGMVIDPSGCRPSPEGDRE